MKIKLETKIIQGFFLSLIILIIISVISYKSIVRMAENAGFTKQSQEVLTNLSVLLSDITIAESAQRGYSITADEKFLEAFLPIEPEITNTLQKLKVMTSGNAFHEKRLKTIEPIIYERLRRIKYLIELRRNEGFEASQREIATGKGKQLQDQISSLVVDMQDEENRMLIEHAQKTKQSIKITKAVIIVGNLLAILFVGAAIALIFLDISKRKKVEKEIKLKNEELQKLNAEKDKFFSIIAHDLKSPFNAIMGFSEILIENVKEKEYDGIEQYADIIMKSSQRTVKLLMNLMEWSRSKTGRMEFSPEHCELVILINEVVLLLSDAAMQKSIQIKKNLPPYLTVYADKAMISTVMRNLVSNAIKFTKPGGEIHVSVEEKRADLLVSVRDTGVGMSKNTLEKLFRIDENYSTPGTLKETGTGLGLILCKEFVEKHGGKIWVESEVGTGSVFSFSLPAVNVK